MAIVPSRTDAKKLFPFLDPDWKSLSKDELAQLHDIAFAVIEKAFEMAQEKAKFAVVGQMYWTEPDGKLKSWDPKAEKVCLGVFPSEAKARDAADSLIGHAGSKELFKVWSLPIWNDSAAQWRKARKASLEALVLEGSDGTQASRLSALVAHQGFPEGHCGGVAPDDEMKLQPCVRPKGHPGSCFAKIPSMEG